MIFLLIRHSSVFTFLSSLLLLSEPMPAEK